MSNIYFKNFDNKDDVLNNFNISEDKLLGCDIVFAYYSYEDYSGDAFVILHHPEEGTFYEVNGNHCSCYGLEGQWEMEETSLEVLLKRESQFFNDVVKIFIKSLAEKRMLSQEVSDIAVKKLPSSSFPHKM